MKKIAYLGPKASFTEAAAHHVFSDQELVSFTTIPECLEAVQEDAVDFAVVPLENAIEGSVPLTLDYLYHDVDLTVVKEILLPIEQHLLVLPKWLGEWQHVDQVLSHPHALAQCHHFLHQSLRDAILEQTTSTAAAAKYVSENSSQVIAAVGNKIAARTYGLAIAKANIHDYAFNHTRFFVLAKHAKLAEDGIPSNGTKTTWMVKLPEDDRSGALHQVLSVFAWRKINLSKIESRPLKTGLGHYFFIIDLLANEKEPMMIGAMEELHALGCEVKSIGTYETESFDSIEKE